MHLSNWYEAQIGQSKSGFFTSGFSYDKGNGGDDVCGVYDRNGGGDGGDDDDGILVELVGVVVDVLVWVAGGGDGDDGPDNEVYYEEFQSDDEECELDDQDRGCNEHQELDEHYEVYDEDNQCEDEDSGRENHSDDDGDGCSKVCILYDNT
ncbi:hypothetical protein AX774_g1210 [Zancudomyces culisetae]|uniref:Uncharacterized protein n=1 Tax=Zancudomyces culisetae TaxID=1213189 RepID=A0A1R1PW81_ZANCU|nr:hypothetical protein AX774_g1210 [Zancudomyces culisetae]|eukprot:OMH85245.1 hypothetical protein AX774_g1210 [Zancudomyces culisetae]